MFRIDSMERCRHGVLERYMALPVIHTYKPLKDAASRRIDQCLWNRFGTGTNGAPITGQDGSHHIGTGSDPQSQCFIIIEWALLDEFTVIGIRVRISDSTYRVLRRWLYVHKA